MNPTTKERLFGYDQAFADPVTTGIVVTLGLVLVLVLLLTEGLYRSGRIGEKLRGELWARTISWAILIPLMVVPLLLGAAPTIIGVGLLGIFCFQEYARQTHLNRDRVESGLVYLGITLLTLAILDNWMRLFFALTAIMPAAIAAFSIFRDKPSGYLQRVALAVLGFTWFGTCLGHLGAIANDPHYRAYLILIFLSVELNDVFAFVVGKTLGRRKLIPNTSPNKTIAGSLGAIVLTTVLVVALGRMIFAGTAMSEWPVLIFLGALISFCGQLGDLMLSSLKRDLGIKDMGNLIPGHGGLLDRFDSLLLVAPCVYHLINYTIGIGSGEQVRIWTG
jgi:phosphatidate cytidylyltransferase